MNILTLIHTNQLFSFSVQLGEFLVFLLLLYVYLVAKRKRQQVFHGGNIPKSTLEQIVLLLLPAISFAALLFLLYSLFPSVQLFSLLLVIGVGMYGCYLAWRRNTS